MSTQSPASSYVADPADLRDIAEHILTPRQYEIWTRRQQGWNEMRIAQWLRVGLRTVEREMKAIRVACREADLDQREGKVRLGHTIAFGQAQVRFAPDAVTAAAARRLGRMERRQPI